MFYEHDSDRNGTLSYEELEVMLTNLGMGLSAEDMNKLIAEVVYISPALLMLLMTTYRSRRILMRTAQSIIPSS
jgi:hypothetical protein